MKAIDHHTTKYIEETATIPCQRNVAVDFTKTGWKRFVKMNRALGADFIRAYVLRSELSAYIAAHYDSSRPLDPVCEEVRYDGGVYLLLKQVGSEWFITDIWNADAPISFSPVLMWARMKRGIDYILRQIVIGWCDMTQKACRPQRHPQRNEAQCGEAI